MGRGTVRLVGILQQPHLIAGHQPGLLQPIENADVIGIAQQFGMLVRPRQSRVLHHKFDIHDTTGVLLEIELRSGVEGLLGGSSMRHAGAEVVTHLRAHLADLAAQRLEIALATQHTGAHPFEVAVSCGQPTSTRARTNAWCSQVQASWLW